MKKLNIKYIFICLSAGIFFTGCYKLQKDYDYQKKELDPHINMTAKEYMILRGDVPTSDSIFKWMKKGIEYAGIDMAEYEKPGRTYIFLHNSAIRTLSSGKTNGGFFFDYPVVVKNAAGVPIKSLLDPTLDSLRPAMYWEDYPRQMVKNYFLYLIIEGEHGFTDLGVPNNALTTLLPPNTTASATDSKLGWVVVQGTPNPDVTAAANITFNPTTGKGFDQEGKINLKLANNDQAPIVINDRTNDRSAGYIATNGQLHVYDKTVHPFRYSYP
jgi:hypothetical protein